MEQDLAGAIDLYRKIAQIRRFEETCLELSAKDLIAGSVHASLGQEAIPVGAAEALGELDRVVATYRGHGWALALGVPMLELLAEICHRSGGINGGRGGSAYLTAPKHRLFGENSIVGAGVPIAAGLALAQQYQETGGIAIVSIGDGAMNQGATHEGLVYAAARDLPLIVICENNGWSEMTAIKAIVRTPFAERVAGLGIESRQVDGCDARAVREAVAEAKGSIAAGQGPVFLECQTVRLSGHYNRDVQHYRSKQDIEAAVRSEPLARLRRELAATDTAAEGWLNDIDEEIDQTINEVVKQVLSMPQPPPETAAAHVVLESPSLQRAEREVGEATEMTYQMAVNLALRDALSSRPEVLVYGEDVGKAGGIFGVTRRLQKEFGAERVFDTPIAESAILGSAVGAAMAGLRPVVEIMWADFLLVALDQLVNQAANVRYVSRGELQAPMVVRTQQGATPGSCAQHSQSLEAFLTHVPGLRVGLPATPHDAYAMLRAAVAHEDPCVLIEARELYQQTGPVWKEAPVEPVFGARWCRDGDDVAIVTWGAMVHKAMDASDLLAGDGIEASVLDLRWLTPLDTEALAQAVLRCGGRVVIAHEANRSGGFGAEIAARISELETDGPPLRFERVATPDVRMPAAPTLQQALLPDAAMIASAARAIVRDLEEVRR